MLNPLSATADEARQLIESYEGLELTDNEKAMLAVYDRIAEGSAVIDLADVLIKANAYHRHDLPVVALAPMGVKAVTFHRDATPNGEGRQLRSRFQADRWIYRLADHRIGWSNWSATEAIADLPSIPPHLRHKTQDGDLMLWEAVWKNVVQTNSADPAILRHVTGTVYEVVAAWDLTSIETALLANDL